MHRGHVTVKDKCEFVVMSLHELLLNSLAVYSPRKTGLAQRTMLATQGRMVSCKTLIARARGMQALWLMKVVGQGFKFMCSASMLADECCR